MKIVACDHCDLVLNEQDIGSNKKASCPRCNITIYSSNKNLNFYIAIAIASILIFFPAIFLPFIAIEMSGRSKSINLIGIFFSLYNNKEFILSFSILIFILIAPIVRCTLILIALILKKHEKTNCILTKTIVYSGIWSMPEVYLIGATITISKLYLVAEITVSAGLFSFITFIIINTILIINLPNKKIWNVLHFD